jgi:hypothetical protein
MKKLVVQFYAVAIGMLMVGGAIASTLNTLGV